MNTKKDTPKVDIKTYIQRNFNIGDSVKVVLKDNAVIDNSNQIPTYVLPEPYMATYGHIKKLKSMNLELNVVDFKDKSQKDFLMLTYISSRDNQKPSLNNIPSEALIKVSYDTIDKIDYQLKSSPHIVNDTLLDVLNP